MPKFIAHSCDLLMESVADPRSPIKRRPGSSGYRLLLNAASTVELLFCPFCGESLTRSGKRFSPPDTPCLHLRQMSRKSESSVFYDLSSNEYVLAGRESLKIRVFYCPLCGRRQRLRRNESDFWKISPAEQAKWVGRLTKVTSIQTLLRELGPPDEKVGPWIQDYFPRGRRMQIGVNKGLFYNKVARTFVIAGIEWLDGTFEVKYYPKEKDP